jgi:hypothetical protein
VKEVYMNGRHQVALWAGVVAFFSSLLAVGIFDVINPNQLFEYLGALIIALITGGSVYAKGRYDDAKKEEEETKSRPTTYRKTGG